MIKEQLLGGLAYLCLRILPVLPPSNDGAPLEDRGRTIEHEDGLSPQEQELANAAEEP